jgi:Nif-specific regulatory protein
MLQLGMVLDNRMVQVQRMGSLKNKLEDMEREAMLTALKECNWVMAKAARQLGITERMIGYKVRKYNIHRKVTSDQVASDEVKK